MSPGVSRLSLWLLWGFGLLSASALAVGAVPIAERDFSSFWVAGNLALSGRAADAYDPAILQATARALIGTERLIHFPYPPHALLLAALFGWLPYGAAFALWDLGSVAVFAWAARPYVPKGFPLWLAALTPAALINLLFGQSGLIYGALWLAAFRGSWAAIGVLTFKPHLGLLAAVEAYRRKAILPAACVALALLGLSLLLFGPVTAIASLSAISRQATLIGGDNHLLWTRLMTTPMSAYGLAGWAFFATSALLLLVRNFTMLSASTATFLIAPYGFHYDMTVVCLGFGLFLFERGAELPMTRRIVAILCFLAPCLVAIGSWTIPPILLGGLIMLDLDRRFGATPLRPATQTGQ